MEKFEYLCLLEPAGATGKNWLNEYGAAGWELVAIRGNFFYFKRRLH